MSMQEVQDWASSYLDKLGLSAAGATVSYVLSIDDENLVKEYLDAMLDSKTPSHRKFIKEFLQKFKLLKERKQDIKDHSIIKKKTLDKKKSQSPEKNTKAFSSHEKTTKKKSKYVSIYSEEAESKDVILLPGRFKCECQALKHKLVNNCLKCGKIVCEQEGSGPCSFCNNLVASKEEQEVLNRGSKKSEALQNRLLNAKKLNKTSEEASLQKAIDHKNKLLEYDQTSEKRTKVYDDQSDYFQSGSKWINPEKREKLQQIENNLQEQKHSRTRCSFTIDLLGRKVITSDNAVVDMNDPQIKELLEDDVGMYAPRPETVHSDREAIPRPVLVSTGKSVTSDRNTSFQKNLHRIQDKLIQEMSDDGMCLSMHQPWATLLVMGIKQHEGRIWYSAHRGRLWIASGTKVPSDEEILEVEDMYRQLYKLKVTFPRNYPAGCLLGCVDVVDILPQEEYRSSFPQGESESPYVFVCENAKEMVIKFPMKGQHKIYKLESKIHKTARRAIKE